jgi:NAD(P)-dependent dehydrogenase (short-subunit alcohol dehydrogenase family)
MKKIVISGGNSGIGLEAARQLTALGHHVVLLGRDKAKGEAALAALKASPGKAEFHSVDLSTHAGVKDAADRLLAAHEQIDALLNGAGYLSLADTRTADDLNPVFAVNYLARYHLTQRLLPALRRSPAAKVVSLVAGVKLDSRIDFNLFPKYKPFPGMGSLTGIQIANHHYLVHLARAEKTISAAPVNVGLVKTEIMRAMPFAMRAIFAILGPLMTIPVARAAANPVHLCTHDGWPSGSYWAKPGKPELVTPLALDAAETERVVAISRELTGV